MTAKRNRSHKPIRELRKAPRTRGPSLDSLRLGWQAFCECALDRNADWAGVPKWQQRYKALRRSARNHGRKFGIIDALEKVQREWEAKK